MVTELNDLNRPFKIIRRFALTLFKDYPHITKSMEVLHGDGFSQRIESFNQALERINTYLQEKDTIPTEYQNLRRFAQLYSEGSIPLLHDVMRDKKEFQQVCERTWNEITSKYPEWANSEYTSAFTPAIGIFLMGYGLFLGERTYGDSSPDLVHELGKAFDHGIEEVLIMDFPDSPILQDVADWIKEEPEEFSDIVHTRINQTYE